MAKRPGLALGFLFLLFGALSSSQTREVPLRILADEEYRASPEWEKKAGRAVAIASKDFKKLFGIRFRISDVAAWDTEGSPPFLAKIAEALDRSVRKGTDEIVVLLTARECPEDAYKGFSIFREGIVVLRDPKKPIELGRVLEHEIGHLYGAVHLRDPDSIMDVQMRGEEFDEVNARLIRFNRLRDFNPVGFPMARENLEEALGLYREVIRRNGIETANPKDETTVGDTIPAPNIRKRLDDACLFAAQVLIELKRYDEAIEECRAARAINPDSHVALNLTAMAMRRDGDLEKAIACYREILAKEPNLARVHFNLGIALAKSGKLLSAMESYSQALKLKPDFAEALSNLGDVLIRLDKVEEAKVNLRKAVALNPEFAMAYSNLAEAHCRSHDTVQALAFAEKAVNLDPGLADAHNILGKVLKALGDPERAKEEFLEAIRIDPEHAKAHNNLAGFYLEKEMTAEAILHYERAVEIREGFAEAHAGLGTCYIQVGLYDEAIEELDRALELGDESGATRLNLSTALLKNGRIEESVSEANRTLELEPGLTQARNNLAIVHLVHGRPVEAESELRRALESDPKNKLTLSNLANLVFSQGRSDEAIELFKQVVEVDPDNAPLQNNLAVAYYRSGEYALAWEHLQKARRLGLGINPDFSMELEKKLRK